MILRFPLPPSDLSPNARVHWAKRAVVVREYRETVGFSALAQMQAQEAAKATGPVAISITFCHSDKRRRDWDNLLASFKAGLDGLVDAKAIMGDSTSEIVCLSLATDHRDNCVIVGIESWP
jgi:crossover junction endodeoxyribonuclease RusA